MIPRILKFFKGDRKYFTIVFFVLILIFLSALITPVIISNIENNWSGLLSEKINNTESEITNEFNSRENLLISSSAKLKKDLREILGSGETPYGRITSLINQESYAGFAAEIYAPNGRLIAWNENSPVLKEIPLPLKFSAGEAYFTSTGLLTWLTIVDTLDLEAEHFYVILNIPFQKHYVIHNAFFDETDFTKELSIKTGTQVNISYSPLISETKDGRYHSFSLLNNKGSRIANVSFLKPAMDTSINSVKEISSVLQRLLLLTGFLLLFFSFKSDFREIESRLLRFLLLVVYFSAFRALLYILNIPASILNGALDDPSLFSSAFAFGIVRSPVEFLITNIFLLFLTINIYRYIRDYIQNKSKIPIWYFILLIPAAFLFLMTARGLNASVRSIIFDSSIRYFRNQEIIPGMPEMVMILNLLLIGFSVVILIVSLVIIPLSFRKTDKNIFFWVTFIFFQVAGYLFIILQKQPLITPVLQIVFISVVFITVWFISRNRESVYNFIYFALAASVISISLLNYFNQHLERESLKTTALELNRPNDNLLNFLLRETLRISASDKTLYEWYRERNANYSAAAFVLWSESPLQRESLSSSISLLDRNKNLLGDFKVGIPDDTRPSAYFENYKGNEIQIVEIQRDDYKKIFKGIVPVKQDNIILGYISASVVYDLRNPVGFNYPDFLMSQKNFFSSVIDASQLRIFEIFNSRVRHVYGDIYPSRDQIKPITGAEYNEDGENWQVVTLNNEKYLSYSLKSRVDGNEKITVVLNKEKQITWNLFNFFKIFVVHAIYIFILLVIIFLARIRKFRYTFRMQLLTAFLLISIIPVIILALYNRQAVSERSQSAISAELSERINYIENHVRTQLQKYKNRDYHDAFENAANELGISFNVYENTVQIFSSKSQYYQSGLFNSKLNPIAHYQLNYQSFREYLLAQNIEGYTYNAFYKKLSLNGKDIILGVDDAFNKVRLSFTSADADILLFGVYFFAVIIIIIINTLLANKISAPIRQLTRATGAVAQGDLNVQIKNRERGELRELIEGFNSMTRELQKNEADLAQLERETAWKEIAKQVAHEIKNPLTPMKLAVQQMIISFRENKNFENIFNKVSATLLSQIENLNQIASEFSRFARMPHFNLEKINIIPILKDTINLFTDEKVKIVFNASIDEAFAEADNSQFRRLFINMIRNSIQAGADKIIFSINDCEAGYEILIEDNGSGIKPEFQEKIFDSDFTTKEKGMGVGLKLAKRFIEAIKGNIVLLRSSSEGTVFRIFIPGSK
jgi:two-component system, NtrC family, nitrogen regulation sensor histidine kinase NtrY